MSIVSELARSVREKGVIRTAKIVSAHFRDLTFDLKYKTDTLRWHELDELNVVGGNKNHGVMYQPTQAHTRRAVFKKTGLRPDGAFLDLGCGKGRALILAAEFGFQKVVGVEFSEHLCDIARANLKRYSQRFSPGAELQVIHADAAGYPIPDEVTTIFLFNPFDDVIMGKVVRNIVASLQKSPRQLHIIYRHPLQHGPIEASGQFQVVGRHSFAQCDFLVYASKG